MFSSLAIQQLALHCPQLRELDLSGSEGIRNTSLDLLEKYLGDNEEMSLVIGGETKTVAFLTLCLYLMSNSFPLLAKIIPD